jgi:RNA polymerase sigma-70 factor (ECF subfamily)
MSHQTSDDAHPQGFASTRWSLVLAAGRGDAPEARSALAALCQIYWYPLYAYVRRSGHPADEAKDLTQEFFARLLEKHYLRAADAERGRFRSFLLTAFKRFLSRERHRAGALKRGGGRRMLALDFDQGESRFRLEPATDVTAEVLYERRWALAMLDRVMAGLRDDFERAGKPDDFDRLKVFLTGEAAAPSYREVAAATGTTKGAVKVAVHRLRRRFRDLVLAEIAQTVTAPEDVEEELRHLFDAIRSRPS